MEKPTFGEEFTKALQLTKSGDTHAAMDLYSKILFEHPEFTPAWNQRGYTLMELGHPFDAILNFDRAVALAPDTPEGYINRGAAYHQAEYFEQALKNYQKAEKLNSLMPEIHNNIGNTLARLNRIEEALQAYKKAMRVDMAYANGHFGAAICLLKMGQFEEGWREFEWRWKSQLPPRGLRCPKWNGDPTTIKNDVLLVYGEQGLGDILQFCRLAPLAKPLWRGKIYVEVPPPLTRIMSTLDGIDGVITLGEKLPKDLAVAIPMMSLPNLLGIKLLEDIPADVPYLHADPYRTQVWQDHLKALPPGMLVGICWAGMRRDANQELSSIDARRSMNLDSFSSMAKIKGISWVSLQLGPLREQVKKPPAGMFIGDWGDHLYDFFDTAALIDALDLVITVDTSVAHMAGALGKPVWVLSRYDACWRWLTNRDDSPWYPSMTLFTQEKPYDWSKPLEKMEAKLNEFKRNWAPRKEAA